jgi:sugar phosphate isomerase/epimerase
MKLGGPILTDCPDEQAWIEAHHALGYRAAYCPLGPQADDATVRRYEQAARQAGIVIAETGAWSNPLSPDAPTAKAAFDKCVAMLDLAERIGARCCVNITGSRGSQWDGPHQLNFAPDTFDMIVQVTRRIVDAVKPTRTFYTLEPMPWMLPDSAQSYEALLDAIDRRAVGVHFDPVNMVCSPRLYHGNAAMIADFCRRLGPRIRSCHAKDVLLSQRLTTHLDEVVAGDGALCYRSYLLELARLDPDMPLMLEHLPSQNQYAQAAGYIRSVAKTVGVAL